MGKSKKLKDLVKNVQFFVKKCREKNKKLLSMSSLDEKDEEQNSGIFTDDKANANKSYRENSTENISKGSSESKFDMHTKLGSLYSRDLRRTQTQGNFHSLFDYLDKTNCNKIIKLKADGGKNGVEKSEENVFKGLPTKDEEQLQGEKSDISSVESKKEKSKDKKMEDVKNEIMEYDLHLLNIYKKLERGSKNGKLFGKNGTKKSKKNTKMKTKIKTKTKKKTKTKTLRTYDSEILNIKNEFNLTRGTSHGKGKTMKLASGGNEDQDMDKEEMARKSITLNGRKSRGLKKKSHEQLIEIKNSFSGNSVKFDSRCSSLAHGEETFSKYLQIGSSKKASDDFYFFQGLSNRLNKRSNTSSYDIGCMYMNNAASTKSSKELGKKRHPREVTTLLNSSKSLHRFKFLNDNKKNIEYYKKMIDSLEGTVAKSKKRSKNKINSATTSGTSSIDSIIKIINCLLHDYVPKLIDRYEYYMNTLDDRNKLLKQKIKESLDFGDIQYEEIRELKSQVMQKNHENKKLSDKVELLKDKLTYINELELKNAEYLDEIVLMRNRVTYLEKLIEENDQSKESHELRKMRRNLKNIYDRMRTEMRHMHTLKSKYFKRYKRRKFSINKWMRLKAKISKQDLCFFTSDEGVNSTITILTSKEGEKCTTSELVEKDTHTEGEEEKKKKDDESSEKKKDTQKQYADKNVDTSDMQNIVTSTDGVNCNVLCMHTQEAIKLKKSKVKTKNKKINTILSNYTFMELLMREKKMEAEKRNNRSNNIYTLIPSESYPYYHYFYSNVLSASKVSGNADKYIKMFPSYDEKRFKFVSPDRVTLSQENYLSLCDKLKECFYETYFHQCTNEPCNSGNINSVLLNEDDPDIFEKSLLHSCDVSPDQERENRKKEKPGNDYYVGDQSQMMMRPNKWRSLFWSEGVSKSDDSSIYSRRNIGKNKCYKLPFDCCVRLNKMLIRKMKCSPWGYNNLTENERSNSSNKKHSARKKSNISNNSSSEKNDKFKMTKIVRKNNLFLHKDSKFRSKNKYYYSQIGSMNGGVIGKIIQSVKGGNGNHRTEKENEKFCWKLCKNGEFPTDEMHLVCDNHIDNGQEHTNAESVKEGNTNNLYIPKEYIMEKCNRNVEVERKNIIKDKLCRNIYEKERIDNFKRFLNIYNLHFERDKDKQLVEKFENEQNYSTSNIVKYEKKLFACVGGEGTDKKYTEGNKCNDNTASCKNEQWLTNDNPNGANKENSNHSNHSSVYQINNYYNYCSVSPHYRVCRSNEVYNASNNLVIDVRGKRTRAGSTCNGINVGTNGMNFGTNGVNSGTKCNNFDTRGNNCVVKNTEQADSCNIPNCNKRVRIVSKMSQNKNISPEQWNPHLHRVQEDFSYTHHDDFFQNKIIAKDSETLRYKNSFNQCFDINTKNFETINKYLHGHVLYTWDV
ncbi:hypothetical protein, conserved [Plasmodium gonderi]|uniref:Liprin-beta-1/2 coiled-coil domain-containing protein n=1 Tax=Plasmodium gonderi TaxID=77519 RepID=A0A1Y1JCB9_PLAGO|nr:hypothetical protein, conserved [Plasmodium gonderi]GAW79318.1 hypothetical protein, conserved [Plasmodium gonderi]